MSDNLGYVCRASDMTEDIRELLATRLREIASFRAMKDTEAEQYYQSWVHRYNAKWWRIKKLDVNEVQQCPWDHPWSWQSYPSTRFSDLKKSLISIQRMLELGGKEVYLTSDAVKCLVKPLSTYPSYDQKIF